MCDTVDDGTNPLTGRPYSKRYYKLLETRQQLPVYQAKAKVLKLIKKYQVVLLVGETGSGKTTQVPQFVLDLQPEGKIACTQPRRVAAMSVSERVAEECDVNLGDEVGYSIRFDDRSSARTRVKYLTDGMLLREAMDDANLSQYSVVILDEAHERTVATDILLGWVKEACERRPELRVVVMSATLEEEKFQHFFPQAPTVHISGRMFGVDVYCSKAPEPNYVEAAIRTATQIHLFEGPGDILIFLTGEEEIETTVERLQSGIPYAVANTPGHATDGSCGPVDVLPLYSALPPHLQKKVFRGAREGTRKIVVSTNIAETSLTIDGIVFVIDSGFSKQKVYNPKKRVESLLVTPISRASANQRMGRAGRTRPGKCFRLYAKHAYDKLLIPQSHPEILRSNLGSIVLQLKRMGVDDLVHFDFVDPPAPQTLLRALELLNWLGALDDDGDLTDDGRAMSRFPVEPETGAMLLRAPGYGVAREMCNLGAMLNTQNPFIHNVREPRSKSAKEQWYHPSGDHISLLQVYDGFCAAIAGASGGGGGYERAAKYSDADPDAANGGESAGQVQQWCKDNYLNFRAMSQARSISTQLWGIMKELNLVGNNNNKSSGDSSFRAVASVDAAIDKANNIRRAVLAGYFCNVAIALPSKNQFQTLKDKQKAIIFPASFLNRRPSFIVFHELVLTSNDYMRTVTSISEDWLIEACPKYFALDEFEDDALGLQAMKAVHRSYQLLHAKAAAVGGTNGKRRARDADSDSD